jgi:anti-sigma B factor antagonist
MNLEKKEFGNVAVLHLHENQITSHDAPDLKTAILGALIGKETKFLFNLSEVESVDSTGLGALLFGMRQAKQHEKLMAFCDLKPKVMFLIKVAHLEDVMDIFETQEKALKKLQDKKGNHAKSSG